MLKNISKDWLVDNMKKTGKKIIIYESRTYETRHIEWHKTCKCNCRLDTSVCNNEQCWNDDKQWNVCDK